MDYRRDYKERKNDVIGILDKAISFYDRLGQTEGGENFKVTSESLASLKQATLNGKFSIVVVGQFSAGKSTFLNALMQEKYLPSFTTETTATVNFLRSINESPTGKELIIVNYKDGTRSQCEDVTLSNIESFVSTKGDHVAQKIESVDVYLDSEFLNDGVALVDSPGLNGILEGHAEITNEQIDRSHAAIFMFNAHQPGSKSDFEILKQLNDRCNSVFIVLNQIDLVKESEQSLDDVVENVRKNYANYFNNETTPEIYPLSAYKALVARSKQDLDYPSNNFGLSKEQKEKLLEESLITGFENRLFKYLTQGEKAKEELLAPVSKVIAILNGSLVDIKEHLDDLQNSTDSQQVQDEIDLLNDQLNKLKEQLYEKKSLIEKEVKEILKDARDEMKSKTRQLREKCLLQIETDEADLEELQANSELYINRMNSSFYDTYKNTLEEADERFKEHIRSQFVEFTNEITDKLNESLVTETSDNIKKITIDISQFDVDANLDEYIQKREILLDGSSKNEDELDNINEQLYKAEINARKRADLDQEIKQKKADLRDELAMMGSRPSVSERQGYIEKRAGGFKGLLKKIWNGNPAKREPYTYYDDSEQKAYDQRFASIKAEFEQDIDETKSKLAKLPVIASEELSYRKKGLEKKLQRQQEELEELKKEAEQKVAKAKKRSMNQAKAYVETRIDDIENNCMKELDSALKGLRKRMAEISMVVLEENVSAAVKQKEATLQRRKQQLDSSVEEKNKIIEQLNNDQVEAEEILKIAKCIEESLQEIEIDTIKRS